MTAVVTDLAQLAPDPTPPPDGDDRVHKHGGQTLEQAVAAIPHLGNAAAARPRAPRPVVAILHGILREGDKSLAVLGMERALTAAGFRHETPSREFGPHAFTELKTFQKAQALTADGEYGPATHKKLAPYYDAYGAWLLAHAAPPEEAVEARIVAAAFLLYHHAPEVHYLQSRPIDGIKPLILPPSFPRYIDCSGSFEWELRVADVKTDPSGGNWDGSGWTGTLSEHGTEVAMVDAEPGDAALYGPRPDHEHVATVVSAAMPGRKAMVVSQGSEGGPYFLPIDYRTDLDQVRRYKLAA